MRARTKYILIGLALIAMDLFMVILGGWLNIPALVDLPRTSSQRLFDAALESMSIVTLLWWAPTSLVGIAAAVLAESYGISIGFALIPTIGLLWFQARIGGWVWTRLAHRIKQRKHSQHATPPYSEPAARSPQG